MTNYANVLLCLVCFASGPSEINSARILGLFPTHSRSHLIIHTAIAEALADSGHNVTVVTTLPSLKNHLPYRYIYIEVPPFSGAVFSKIVNNRPLYYKVVTAYSLENSRIANMSLHHPLMKKLMQEESFDLVIFGYLFNDFMFGVAAHFKCPLVLSFTMRPFNNVNDFIGNPMEMAYVPQLFGLTDQLNGFFYRVYNFLDSLGKELTYRPPLWLIQEYYYRANFPSDKFPSLSDMKKNISLVLTTHHFSQGPIRPNVPTVVEIGGIHIKDKPDPLPEDLQSILDNSTEHGAIYFSLGTSIHGKHLDASKVNIIFEVLSELPQTVLCKWSDDDFPSGSRNIFYRKWMPQNSILHHPNVKLFITHGGLGGMTEAQFFGVPMVAVPLSIDQFMNAKNIEKSGFGLGVDYSILTKESMFNTVREILDNRTYTDNVKRFSRLYKDRPMSGRETAVYWVEYVIRHHGAPHLQSPAVHLNILQILSLDVVGFLLLILYLIVKTAMLTCFFLKKFCGKTKFKLE